MQEGHRARLRGRLESCGFCSFSESEALELLLTYAIPRKDTSATAGALLSRFGTLKSVLNAKHEALCSVSGVGTATGNFLRLIGDIANTYISTKPQSHGLKGSLKTPAAAAGYALELLKAERYESVYVVSLDKNLRLLQAERLFSGTLTEAPMYPRRVVEAALSHCAHSVLLLHNHPSGDPSPSASDIEATQAVKSALNAIDIALFDHIIVGHESAYSFSCRACISP